MIVLLLWVSDAFAILVEYDVQVRAVTYTDGRDYLGFEADDGGTPEARALSFEIDFADIPTGPSKLHVDQIGFTWTGTAGIASSLQLWRDADGDQVWDPDADTLVATLPIASGRATWAPSAETLARGEQRTYHLTAVLDGDATGCGVILAGIGAAADVKLTDNDPLLYRPNPTGSFPLASTAAAGADVVEPTIGATVTTQPVDTVAGYAAEATFALAHCDGAAVTALAAPSTADVTQGGAVVDAVTVPDLEPFSVAWTVPPDATGAYRFEIGGGALAVPGDRGTTIGGPPADVVTVVFDVLANPHPRVIRDRSPTHSAPAGGAVDLVVEVTDENGVSVAGETVTFEVVDDLEPSGSVSEGTQATDGSGTATVPFTLSETTGVNRVSAWIADDAVEIAITGYSDDIDAVRSTLTAAPLAAIADGTDPIAIEVVARDPNGNPVPGVPVTLTTSGGTLTVSEGSTDADGRFAAELRSDAIGTVDVGASLGDVALGPIAVEFRAVPTTGLWGDPWPNPVAAGGTLHVPFTVGSTADVEISVRDLVGAEVATLTSGTVERGYHETTWTADAAAGAYVVRITEDGRLVEEAVVAVDGGRGCDTTGGGALALGLAAAGLVLARRRGAVVATALLIAGVGRAGELPTEGIGADARVQALGGAGVATHEVGLAIAQNPATLETATAPVVALGWADRAFGLQQVELLAAAPLGPVSLAVTGRGGFGPRLAATGDGGAPLGEEPVGTRSAGVAGAWTPAPALSVGAAVRGATLGVGGEAIAGAVLVDAGLLARPNVPGLQLGAAVHGVGAAGGPDARAGFAFALDDELLPAEAPDVVLTAQAGFGGQGASVGAGVEVAPLPLAALRGGFALDGAGRRATVGLGLSPGPARIDYALGVGDGLHHGVTVTVAAAERRERAAAVLRAQRDAAREEALADAVERAKEQARATTTADLAGAQIRRVEATLATADLDESGRARPEQILAGARAALAEGRNDDAWMLAVDADLALAEELGRLREERLAQEAEAAHARADAAEAAARAKPPAGTARSTTGGTATSPAMGASPATQGPAGAQGGTGAQGAAAGPVSPEAAQALMRAGLEAYRQGLFAVAASRWKEARTMDPTLPGIDGYIANAEAKHATLEELENKRR